MQFIRRHKILVTVLVLLAVFAGFNLLRERRIDRVRQDQVPSAEIVREAVTNADLQKNQPQPSESNTTMRSGTFVNGAKAYKGQGTARTVLIDGKPVLSFGDDFKTSSGPDLQVYLSRNADVKAHGLGEFITLGALKSTSGAQAYNLPDDHADYASVVIWCRAFTSLFAQAPLH